MVKTIIVNVDPELSITYDPSTNLGVIISDEYSTHAGLVVIGDVEELDKLVAALQQASKEMKARVPTRST